jgi:hypothetical protein
MYLPLVTHFQYLPSQHTRSLPDFGCLFTRAPPPKGLSKSERRMRVNPRGVCACAVVAFAKRPPLAARHRPRILFRNSAGVRGATDADVGGGGMRSLLSLAIRLFRISPLVLIMHATLGSALHVYVNKLALYFANPGSNMREREREKLCLRRERARSLLALCWGCCVTPATHQLSSFASANSVITYIMRIYLISLLLLSHALLLAMACLFLLNGHPNRVN